MGQNNTGAWNDLASSTGASPAGGPVYYSVRNDAFTGTCQGSPCHTYLAFLGQRGAGIEVGVDWKDNPPGWNGQNGDEETASQQATEAIAQGTYDAQFNALVAAIRQYPSSTFYVRLDYEVSTAFDCLNGTNCSSLYPGDQWVDWIGLSVFNQDLCQPYWENGTTYWNGQENTSDRTCLGYYDDYVNGNVNAIAHEYPIDLNILRMTWFAQQHNKPMMIAESGVQRMSSTLNANGTQNDSDYAAFMNRLSTLPNYVGPLPNGTISGQQTNFIGTNYNLSGVVKMVTYINIDWRYGLDGQTSADAPRSRTEFTLRSFTAARPGSPLRRAAFSTFVSCRSRSALALFGMTLSLVLGADAGWGAGAFARCPACRAARCARWCASPCQRASTAVPPAGQEPPRILMDQFIWVVGYLLGVSDRDPRRPSRPGACHTGQALSTPGPGTLGDLLASAELECGS
ncbi:MAG TPA: hypothetical protein VGX23_12430 [Actinocrinis sp.]|nr:hypothetical protein [Actinocrinis sp.]